MRLPSRGKLAATARTEFGTIDKKHVLTEIWMDSKKVGCQVIQDHEHTDKHKKKAADAKRKKHSSEAEGG